MKKIEIFIHGQPKGQPRPRAFSRGGMTRVYDPATAEGWKSQIAMALKGIEHEMDYNANFVVYMGFYMPRPKSHYHTSKAKAGQLREDAPIWFNKKPDIDNLVKAVLDCITELNTIWKDDCQVTEIKIDKLWANNNKTGMLLWIWELDK
jgi:crossover junction endodeoxyribonuclease RusA